MGKKGTKLIIVEDYSLENMWGDMEQGLRNKAATPLLGYDPSRVAKLPGKRMRDKIRRKKRKSSFGFGLFIQSIGFPIKVVLIVFLFFFVLALLGVQL